MQRVLPCLALVVLLGAVPARADRVVVCNADALAIVKSDAVTDAEVRAAVAGAFAPQSEMAIQAGGCRMLGGVWEDGQCKPRFLPSLACTEGGGSWNQGICTMSFPEAVAAQMRSHFQAGTNRDLRFRATIIMVRDQQLLVLMKPHTANMARLPRQPFRVDVAQQARP